MAGNVKEGASLRFLYRTAIGRMLLKVLTARWISKLCGIFLDSKLSKPLIKSFVNNNGIDLSDFETDDFRCFNDCFSRKIREGKRVVPEDESVFFSPCDGYLSAYRLKEDTVLPVKQSRYTLTSLLQNEELAEKYRNGICLVFRLCVNHYHRYCYPVSGVKGENVFIKGRLHTVRPIALAEYPVFTENCREYTVIESDEFGSVLQMEVGAMLVGKIANHHSKATVIRGQEKGKFLYGGSTIIVLLQKDSVKIKDEFFEATANGEETSVYMCDALGESIKILQN